MKQRLSFDHWVEVITPLVIAGAISIAFYPWTEQQKQQYITEATSDYRNSNATNSPVSLITNLTVEAFTNVLDCPTLEIQLQEYILINDQTGEPWMHLHRIDDSQPSWWSSTNVELWVKGTIEQVGMTNGGWNIYRFTR